MGAKTNAGGIQSCPTPCGRTNVLWRVVFPFLFFLHASVVVVKGQFASSTYYMDSPTDCYMSGYSKISSDGVVNIYSQTPSGGSSDVQKCILRFRPEDTRHIIDVSFTHLTISDSSVTLHVEVTGGGSYTLRAGSSKPNVLSSKGGMATLTLSRLSIDDKDFSFGITVRVYKEDDGLMNVDDSPGPVGLLVGLITGIIAFLIFLAILIVCCYRRRKEQYMARAAHQDRSGYKADLAVEDPMSPSNTFGLDNNAAPHRGMFTPQRGGAEGRDSSGNDDDDYNNYSPRMERKPLTPPVDESDYYRDRSGSESDGRDRYIMRDYEHSPRKTVSVKYEDERSGNSWQEGGNGRKPRDYARNDEGGYNQRGNEGGNNRSPELDSQNANLRFVDRERANPQYREREVAPRTPRLRADNSSDNGSVSDASSRDRSLRGDVVGNSQRSQPPEKTPRKPNPLPPVPRSPRSISDVEGTPRTTQPPRQLEPPRNIQPYLRNSSSSSEPEQSREERGGGAYNRKDKLPSSPKPEEKPDTRHVLRPDRTKKKKSPEKSKSSPDLVSETEYPAKPPKKSVQKEKDKSKPDNNKKSKGKKNGSDSTPRQDGSEYEGRFKKSDTARKSKGKSKPRLGRSRSTGNALDDTESIGRGSVSSVGGGGYRAVPSVTADDYEDSDVESNYNPLRRTNSKTSLYASRSSLYGRSRRRKNSFGESVYSYSVYDDPDNFDRGSVKDRSLSRRHRGFKSLGDIEMECRRDADQASSSARSRAASRGDRDTASQTGRPRKNSMSSNTGRARSKSRDRKNSVSSTTSGRPKRAKSESELRRKVREAELEDSRAAAREKPRPKPKPRKSTSTMGDGDSVRTAVGGGGGEMQPIMPMYAPQGGYPGYMVGYPPPQMPYVGGQPPPGMVPYGMVPVLPGVGVPQVGAGAPRAGAGVHGGPPTAPKPAVDKWEMLCRITDAARERDGAESVAGSVFSS